MSAEKTLDVVRNLFAKISGGDSPESISECFSQDVDWSIPGASEIAPWVGERKGRQEVAAFYRDFGKHLAPVSFDITTMMAENDRCVALGALECKVLSTGKTINSEFAIEFMISDGLISRYRFYENSYGVAVAAR